MRTALFTGAGASRAIGYPLTRELLPRVRYGLRRGNLFTDLALNPGKEERDRNELNSYLLGLLPGFEGASDDQLPLITDLFSLVEHALVSGEALPIGGEGSLRCCRDLLKQAITDIILGDSVKLGHNVSEEQEKERAVHLKFTGWAKLQGDRFGLVTTNYDISMESQLYSPIPEAQVSEVVDLGFDWRRVGNGAEQTRPAQPKLRVYKLHGSLDVLKCRLCGYVYFNPFGNIAHQAFKEELDITNTCHCGYAGRLELHIVSPSFVREVRDANLLSIWRSALEWMRNADRWIIVGYSLPPEDLAVRSLLLRAYATASKKPDITVVQQNDDARSRYQLLFPNCTYENDGLKGFLERSQ